jgi:hypothetical protein
MLNVSLHSVNDVSKISFGVSILADRLFVHLYCTTTIDQYHMWVPA